jgi:hypothetical protein
VENFLEWFPGVKPEQCRRSWSLRSAVWRSLEHSLAGVKIWFDQLTPLPLRAALSGHRVTTVYEMGGCRNERLGRGRHEQAIDDAWETAPPHKEPRPMERGSVGQHLAVHVTREGSRGRASAQNHADAITFRWVADN